MLIFALLTSLLFEIDHSSGPWPHKDEERFDHVKSTLEGWGLGSFKGEDLPHINRVLGKKFNPDSRKQAKSIRYLAEKYLPGALADGSSS